MQNKNEQDIETLIESDIMRFTLDPFNYVEYAFPWGEEGTALANDKAPRVWQGEVLQGMANHLGNPKTRFEPLGIAVASGHGVGKSALIGMIGDWAMATCDDCRIVITSNTEGQLRTKTAPEVLKWSNMSIVSHWFNTTAMSIYSNEHEHEKSWRMDFIPWSIAKPESFAGLHNKNKRIVIVMDEASAIDDIIWEVIEGALTDEGTEIIWIVFGNPTRNVGRFRECWRKHSASWQIKMKIDAREVEGTNKKLFEKWAKTYGEDSDFFKVRVKGEFPSQSASQFISTDVVEAARGRHLAKNQFDFAPVIITCDPAWTGDDHLVIAKRQGLHFEILDKIPKNNNDILIANKIARYETDFDADAVFIDGGYGTGIISGGTTMGRNWQIVWFSGESIRPDCVNKRAEMYVEAAEWLDAGGAIPDDDDLCEEITAIETMPMLDGKFKFPPKDAMKSVIGRSPNLWDSLVLTFAFPVLSRRRGREQERHEAIHDYDPFE